MLFNTFILDISTDKKLKASVWHIQRLSADRKKEKHDLEGLRDAKPPAAYLVSFIFPENSPQNPLVTHHLT